MPLLTRQLWLAKDLVREIRLLRHLPLPELTPVRVAQFRGRQAPPNCYRQSFSRDRPLTKFSAY